MTERAASPVVWRHRLEYGALRTVVALLGVLGVRRAGSVGAWIGRLGYAPLGIRRQVVERQLAAAFPERDAAAVSALAAQAYAHLGRVTLEAALLSRLGPQAVLQMFSGADHFERLEHALAGGRGLILVSGHFGNWELLAAYMAARGLPVSAVAMGMENPLVGDYTFRTRRRLGIEVVHDQDAVRRIPRALRENRIVGMLADQGVQGLAATFVPFFGRPARTPRGPAVFVLRADVPILFVAAVREPDGRYRFICDDVPVEHTGDRERDIDAMVAAWTLTLERWVRRHPEQYFWHHRRWKRQPEGTPPALRDPAAGAR